MIVGETAKSFGEHIEPEQVSVENVSNIEM